MSIVIEIMGEILGRWTVPPDVDVLDIELSKFEQGKYYEIFVYAFQIADHPVLGDIWFHDNYSSAWDSREPPLYYLFSCGAYGLKQENVSGTSYYNIIENPVIIFRQSAQWTTHLCGIQEI